jgi:uncharacterized protein (DUF2267 family)
MSTATLSAFDSTLHKTNVWLKDVMEELRWDDFQRAYRALRAVLHALRDRLPMEEATDLGAQLPMLVRGFYYEGWSPRHTPVLEHKLEQFLQHIEDQFRGDPHADAEQIARAVFHTLDKHVTAGELQDVKRNLPEAVRALWT